MVVKHLLLVPWRVTPFITGLVAHLVPPPHVPIGISQAGEGGETRSEQRCHLWQGCGPFKGCVKFCPLLGGSSQLVSG